MYRTEADLIMGFNCLALAILETEDKHGWCVVVE